MDKKKKHLNSWLQGNRMKLSCFVTLLVAPFIGYACLFLTIVYGAEILARIETFPMRFWELPPQSEFVSFEMEVVGGGNSEWVRGQLTIRSYLPEEIIQEFYRNKYHPNCGIDGRYWSVTVVSEDAEGQRIYEICDLSQFD